MDKKNLTVVVVNDFDYVQGGASKVAIDTANILYNNGVNVIFFSSTHKKNNYKFKQVCTNQKECLKDGIKGAFRGLFNFKVKKEFSKLLDDLDRDTTVIHVHGWTKSLSSVIFKVAKQKKFKVVITAHDYFSACPNGGFYNYKKCEICKEFPMSFKCIKINCDSRNYLFKLYRLLRQKIQNKYIKKSNANYIYISNFSKKILKNKKLNDFNNIVISNSIETDKINYKDSSLNDNYLFLGRLSKEKGIELFCSAIDKLGLNGIVVGDGPERKRLEKKYSSIKFVGWQEHKNIINFLNNARVLVFSSLLYETMGMTALEALSYGVPVLVGDNCATSDYVQNDFNGYIYEIGNVDSLIEKLVLCNDENISRLSNNAYREYWNHPYSEEVYKKNIIAYYMKICYGDESNE